MSWRHKPSQQVKEQLNFTNLSGFRSLSTIVWKIWASFGEKMTENEKSRIFWYFTKMEITLVQNDLENWNLAKSWRSVLSEIASRHFSIFRDFDVFHLAIFKRFWSNFGRKRQNFQKCSNYQKSPCSDFRYYNPP